MLPLPSCDVSGSTPSKMRFLSQTPVSCLLTVYVLICFFFFFILIFTLFYFTILYWLCHTLTWIHHGCTWIPKHELPSHLPSHIISLDHPRAPAPIILYPVSNIDWQLISYMIVYMFQCHLPNHPTLSLSLWVQKSVLYICVSFAVSHTGSSLPSF